MLDVTRGPDGYRPEIHWLYPDDTSVPLTFYARCDARCEVRLLHSQVLVLDILVERWILDHDVIDEYRGFVHVIDLAREYDRRAGRREPIQATTIVRYISRIYKRMEKAVGKDVVVELPFRLIENRRGVGYRIAGCGLRIHDPFRDGARANALRC